MGDLRIVFYSQITASKPFLFGLRAIVAYAPEFGCFESFRAPPRRGSK